MKNNPRQITFLTLRNLESIGQLVDVVFNQNMSKSELGGADRRLATELVYGCIRRRRSLDALIDQLGKKTSNQQPPALRIILHIGLYQLCYLNQIPASAAVNTSVELAKENGLSGLKGVVNGVLRQYLRQLESQYPNATNDSNSINPVTILETLLNLPQNPIQRLGILYSFPDWIVQFWIEELGAEDTEKLCQWFNQSPTMNLRINPLKTTLEEVKNGFQSQEIAISSITNIPQAIRLNQSAGQIQKLPGYNQGWWTVQDSSAQLVSHLLDPQPGELIIDACAAPGGKTTHIAELIQDTGKVLGLDKVKSRLKKLQQSIDRLQLNSIEIKAVDIRECTEYNQIADRVLLDAPCSGLGTLHRRADARWRQTLENIQTLSKLQSELLEIVAKWVKPGGCLVYATCTLYPLENEAVIQSFLTNHSEWKIQQPPQQLSPWTQPEGWIKVWPHLHNMDGFFMVKLSLQ
ncbi:MAG: 16S rRNA (cytosine(967)-C(5))-methyltransferase [Microcoleaceae cyanobacterium]